MEDRINWLFSSGNGEECHLIIFQMSMRFWRRSVIISDFWRLLMGEKTTFRLIFFYLFFLVWISIDWLDYWFWMNGQFWTFEEPLSIVVCRNRKSHRHENPSFFPATDYNECGGWDICEMSLVTSKNKRKNNVGFCGKMKFDKHSKTLSREVIKRWLIKCA